MTGQSTAESIQQAPSLQAIQQARARIVGLAARTPLTRLQHPGAREIYLKLEQLQPIGSFKIRCAANALLSMSEERRNAGVVTASAGNFAQGLGYVARRLGLRATALVPETAARSKLEALERLGVTIEPRPYAEWWSILENPAAHGFDDRFIHPCASTAVMAGNGTIGLEILDEVQPELVLVPYGGGGLAAGVAAAMKSSGSHARIVAVETTAGTPVAAAFAAGKPVSVPFDSTTFITGMGSPQVLAPMWPLIHSLIDATARVTLSSVADAVRLLVQRHHVVAEGAGAAPIAAALQEPDTGGPIVCVVSGGHLDSKHLIAILSGETP